MKVFVKECKGVHKCCIVDEESDDSFECKSKSYIFLKENSNSPPTCNCVNCAESEVEGKVESDVLVSGRHS